MGTRTHSGVRPARPTRPGKAPAKLRRRGSTLIYTVVAMTALLGFCSLAVDFGRVELDKTSLQVAADAACRAACCKLSGGVTAAQNAAIHTAAQNSVEGNPVSHYQRATSSSGPGTPTNKTFTVLTGANQANANAIRVTTGLTAARGNAIPLTFASLLGKGKYDLTCKSTACLAGNTGNCSLIGLNGITMTRQRLHRQLQLLQGRLLRGVGQEATAPSPPTATSP